jgi:serine/threonine-protein kinase
MAPEQMRGQRVDHRADVYSLGCILFEILANERALSVPSPLDAADAVAECHRPSARWAGEPEREGREPVAPELDDLCARATAADPEARVGSARELADGIQHFLDGDRDVARRRDLATAHAATATTRLAESGDAARRDAMREAGRAIALDPTNAQAQQLLARLLLEPPREIPAEVRAEIVRDQIVGTQNVLRLGAYCYTGNLLLVPLGKILGVAGSWPFVVIAALLGLQIAACAIGSRRTRPLLRSEFALMLGVHLILIVVVAVCLGPLLLAPFFVFGALPITLMFPSLRLPKTLFVLHLLAVGIPLGLEALGVLPASAWTDGGAIVLKPWAVHADPAVLLGIVLVAIVAQMIVVLIVFTSQRAAQERATERLHVTAWHLRQLID